MSITNPRKLELHAATQVCGRCHSASQPLDPADYLQSGLAFRPGDDLHAFITLNDFDPRRERPISQAGEIFVEDYPIDGYWSRNLTPTAGLLFREHEITLEWRFPSHRSPLQPGVAHGSFPGSAGGRTGARDLQLQSVWGNGGDRLNGSGWARADARAAR